MAEIDISKEIKQIDSREKMIRYLDGYSADRMEELDQRKVKLPLVKSYMLEHVGDGGKPKEITKILSDFDIESEKIDESLYRILDKRLNGEYMGFLEVLTPRYFAFYTLHHSEKADRWIKNLVFNSSELDHIWLSGITFNVLWNMVSQLSKPNRYASLLFIHESIYQVDTENYEDEEEENKERAFDKEDIMEIVERRASKFKLTDKISEIQEKLSKLQEIYSPLYAICQLRFPSPIGRGGHDFYDNGKVTNRSGDFKDHRSHILYVQKLYEDLTRKAEEKAWYSIYQEEVSISGQFQGLIGAPVIIKFEETLSKEIFNHWIKSVFGRINESRFKIWGNPIWLGPTKVHIYGVDKHLWRPIFLEITEKYLLAIIPKGTCGNTIHRLICNIQRYIDPAAKAYIGDTEYKTTIEQSTKGVKYEPEYK